MCCGSRSRGKPVPACVTYAEFCSCYASYVSASRTVVAPLTKGRHTVKIRFWSYDSSTEVNIGNATLLVFD